MSNFNGTYRWGATTSLNNVASGTAVASTAVFGSQTRRIRVMSSVGSVSVLVADGAVSSVTVDTTGMLIAPGVPEYFLVTPGQTLAAHSQSVTTTGVYVTEATT